MVEVGGCVHRHEEPLGNDRYGFIGWSRVFPGALLAVATVGDELL